MNTCILTGRLTAVPELKQTPGGKYVSSFDIAVKRPHTNDVTDFIHIVAWNKTAEFITKYFKKGQMIAIRGHLTIRNYEDKNGNKRYISEVICDEADFCGSREDINGTESAGAVQEASGNTPGYADTLTAIGNAVSVPEAPGGFEEVGNDDDLPF